MAVDLQSGQKQTVNVYVGQASSIGSFRFCLYSLRKWLDEGGQKCEARKTPPIRNFNGKYKARENESEEGYQSKKSHRSHTNIFITPFRSFTDTYNCFSALKSIIDYYGEIYFIFVVSITIYLFNGNEIQFIKDCTTASATE